MAFNSYEQIHKGIAAVNSACYSKIKANTFFLEQVTEKNLVKVMQEIRDGYDHLHHIYSLPDPFSHESQKIINSEFEKYKGHMQRLAIETLRKVFEYYLTLIKDFLLENKMETEWAVVKAQVAQQVKTARDREVSNNFHDRYAAWEDALDFTESVGKRYGIWS